MSEYVNVDVDMISYFELKDYIKELRYNTSCTFSIRPPNSGIIRDIDNDRAIVKIAKCLENGGSGRGGSSTSVASLSGSGRGKGKPKFSCSTPNSSDIPSASTATRGRGDTPKTFVAARGRGRDMGSTTPYKKPRIMRMGMFQAEISFTAFNPGMPSRRIVSTGSTRITKSADVMGDVDFKSTSGLK
ncbi:hypothetical protein HAX54_040268 [Datura stramonium]|uniref:Uncharacterized protein n=1 Tax=Datura stramonium TaxID=4076 RepID=A0ABS8SJU6_DATST|nr:hypothetical protein [Datura stramonium]